MTWRSSTVPARGAHGAMDRQHRPAHRQHAPLRPRRALASRCPWACAGELYIGGIGWRAATWVGPSSPRSASSARSLRRRTPGAALPDRRSRAGGPTASSSSSAASITRSRSAVSASSSARSRRCSARTPTSSGARSSCGRTRRGTGASSPTSSAARAALPTARALRAWLRSGCPTTWCRRPSWRSRRCRSPPSGKVDRRALPAPDGRRPRQPALHSRRAGRRGGARRASSPRCSGGRADVGAHDDFFAPRRPLAPRHAGDRAHPRGRFGGRSAAARALRGARPRPSSRCGRRCGALGAPPGAGAEVLRSRRADRAADRELRAVVRPGAAVVPRPAPSRAAPSYNDAGRLAAPARARSIRDGALERAFDALVARHEVLRDDVRAPRWTKSRRQRWSISRLLDVPRCSSSSLALLGGAPRRAELALRPGRGRGGASPSIWQSGARSCVARLCSMTRP